MEISRKIIQVIFLFYFFIVLSLAVLPPFVSIWNQINPHVLGLPFAQFSILAFAFALGGGLVAWYLAEERLNKKESIVRSRRMSND
jgi:hypothetical protein